MLGPLIAFEKDKKITPLKKTCCSLPQCYQVQICLWNIYSELISFCSILKIMGVTFISCFSSRMCHQHTFLTVAKEGPDPSNLSSRVQVFSEILRFS